MVAILLSWVIYRDLNGYSSLSSWHSTGLNHLVVRWTWLAIIVALVFVNWSLEALKWKMLFKGQKSFSDAFREVLVGVTTGLITPGRVGEYFGRHYVSKHGSLAANVSGTFISSVSQNIVNVAIGLFAFFSIEKEFFSLPSLSPSTIVTALVILSGLVTLCVLKRSYIVDWIRNIGFLEVSRTLFSKIVFVSLIRYLIYSSQFVLMFWALGGNPEFFEMLTLVAIVYLIQSGLPLPPFLAALARVEIALLIFSYHVDNELLIVCSTLIIWIINVIGPALLGWVYLLKTNRQ